MGAFEERMEDEMGEWSYRRRDERVERWNGKVREEEGRIEGGKEGRGCIKQLPP